MRKAIGYRVFCNGVACYPAWDTINGLGENDRTEKEGVSKKDLIVFNNSKAP